MTKKNILAASLILLISTLVFYVSAQVQTEKGQDTNRVQGAIGVGYGGGVGLPSPPLTHQISLFRAKVGVDGKIDYVQVLAIDPPGWIILPNGKLRIDLLDGSVQNIDLKMVKEISIQS